MTLCGGSEGGLHQSFGPQTLTSRVFSKDNHFSDLFEFLGCFSVISECWDINKLIITSLTQAHCVFGNLSALILTVSKHPCSAIDMVIFYRGTRGDRNTDCSLRNWWTLCPHSPSLHYSACIFASDLCGIPRNQMKTFPSAVSAVPRFLGPIIPTPTKSHTHTCTLSHGECFLPFVRRIAHHIQAEKSEQLRNSHQSIMDNMSWSRKEGWPCSIYYCFSVWV